MIDYIRQPRCAVAADKPARWLRRSLPHGPSICGMAMPHASCYESHVVCRTFARRHLHANLCERRRRSQGDRAALQVRRDRPPRRVVSWCSIGVEAFVRLPVMSGFGQRRRCSDGFGLHRHNAVHLTTWSAYRSRASCRRFCMSPQRAVGDNKSRGPTDGPWHPRSAASGVERDWWPG